MALDLERLWRHIEGEYDWSSETRRDQFERAYALFEEDERVGLNELKAQAVRGSVASMQMLAFVHQTGKHGRPDIDEAERWMRMAADSGSTRQIHDLARFYQSAGLRSKAIIAYRRAVGRGYVPSMIFLAFLYWHGKGIDRDLPQAKHLLKMAVKAGSVPAQAMLGTLRLRQWYNPISVFRGISGLRASAPAVFKILDGSLTTDEAPKHSWRTSLWWPLFGLLAILSVGGYFVLDALTRAAAALGIPLWVTVAGGVALVALVLWLIAKNEAHTDRQVQERMKGWPFKG